MLGEASKRGIGRLECARRRQDQQTRHLCGRDVARKVQRYEGNSVVFRPGITSFRSSYEEAVGISKKSSSGFRLRLD
jgi:hypothetical protein